ncbi:hypothetical protein Tco_0003842 [Tanacetum coccineum]
MVPSVGTRLVLLQMVALNLRALAVHQLCCQEMSFYMDRYQRDCLHARTSGSGSPQHQIMLSFSRRSLSGPLKQALGSGLVLGFCGYAARVWLSS